MENREKNSGDSSNLDFTLKTMQMIDLTMGIVQGKVGKIMEGVKMMTLVEKIEGRRRRNIIS